MIAERERDHVRQLLLRDRGAAGQPPLRDGVHAAGKGHTEGKLHSMITRFVLPFAHFGCRHLETDFMLLLAFVQETSSARSILKLSNHTITKIVTITAKIHK